jgi:hypothetical protein
MRLLGTVRLSPGDWVLATLSSVCPVLLLEMFKAIRARDGRR